MADRRMFSASVVETDAFLDLPLSAQALFFHLGMNSDDDGFVASPKRVLRCVGASDDDMRLLIAKGFVLVFSSGVLVITHHHVMNRLRKDRRKPTVCETERAQVELLPSGAYALTGNRMTDVCQPLGGITATATAHNQVMEQSKESRNRGNLDGDDDYSALL